MKYAGNTPEHSFKPPLSINIIYSHPMVYTFSLTKFVAFLPENAMLTGTGITCPFKHGQSSSERCSVMILDPVVGNLWKARDSQKRKHHMSSKLFVGNLSFKTTENELQDAFAEHGTVLETNLMMDRATGRPRGFGFVTMSTPEEAQKAIEALNGASIDGRALTVNVARPREDRPPGGGGGRRDFGGGGGGGGPRRGGGGGGGGRDRY